MSNGAKFCPKCGAANTVSKSANTPAQPPVQPVQTPIRPVQPPVQPVQSVQPAYVNPVFKNDTENNHKKDKQKKPKKKGAGKAIIAVVCVVLILLGAGGGCFWYINSDFYKLKQAQEFITAGSYDEARNVLNDVSSDKADLYLNYIEIEDAKNVFLESFKEKLVVSTDDNSYVNMQNFITAVRTFSTQNDYNQLPSDLKSSFELYKKICDAVSECSVNIDDINKSQYAFMVDVTINRGVDGINYRTDVISGYLNDSKIGIEQLKSQLLSIADVRVSGKYIDLSQGKSAFANTVFNDFLASCDEQILSAQKTVDAKVAKYGPATSLLVDENRDPYYVGVVLKDLYRISDAQKCQANADVMYYTLQVGIMARYLSE